MTVCLIHIDGKLPNIALMAISNYEKGEGKNVVLKRKILPELFDPEFDRIYASSIFEFSRKKIETVKKHYPDVIIGGTGTGNNLKLEDFIDDVNRLDYTIYPYFMYSIGYSHRGCRMKCDFCVVPQKEGSMRENQSIKSIWRGGENKNIILLDNDFFGQPKWAEKVEEIIKYKFKVSLTQGINIRLLKEDHAEAIKKIDPWNLKFDSRRLYTAFDNIKDERLFRRGMDKLKGAGYGMSKVMVYCLIGYDPNETEDSIFYRLKIIESYGAKPYPMLYKRTELGKKLQQYYALGLYRFIKWADYKYK